MRRPRQPPAHYAGDLAELVHETFLGVQPARGIDDNRVQTTRAGGVDRIKSHRGRVSPGCASNAGKPQAVGPDLQLRHGPSPVRIRGGKQHLATLLLKLPVELGSSGCLSSSIDPNDENDRRARTGSGDVSRS